jgi:hypothetical protein
VGDFVNITLNGKPLAEFLSNEYRIEIEQHFATVEMGLRRAVARGRSMPVPIALQKRGRKPIEVRSWTMAEIKGLAVDQSLSIDEIANRAEQPSRLVRLCLRRLGIKRKRGRKKAVRQPDECSTKIQQAAAEDNTTQCRD